MSITQTELARALGVSHAIISRNKAQGMPVDSIEAARAWRVRNIRPRMSNMPARSSRPPPLRSAAFAAAESLALHAGEQLARDASITALVPALRASLRAVPDSERPELALPLSVLQVLTADVLAVVQAEAPDDAAGELSDDDAEWLGRFWFAVCAGEVRPA